MQPYTITLQLTDIDVAHFIGYFKAQQMVETNNAIIEKNLLMISKAIPTDVFDDISAEISKLLSHPDILATALHNHLSNMDDMTDELEKRNNEF